VTGENVGDLARLTALSPAILAVVFPAAHRCRAGRPTGQTL